MWYIVNKCPYETTIEDREIGRIRSKSISELSVQNKANLTLNVKVMNVLDANKSNRIKGCKIVKEI